MKFRACTESPKNSRDGPTYTKGKAIAGVSANWVKNSILPLLSFPKLHEIKSIVFSPINAITPQVVGI